MSEEVNVHDVQQASSEDIAEYKSRCPVTFHFYQQWVCDGSWKFWRFAWWDFTLFALDWERWDNMLEIHAALLGVHVTAYIRLRKRGKR